MKIPVLNVSELNIYYDSFQAVNNMSFSIYEGEIFGLLGPNGAGKTSTLSAIEGLVAPNGGTIVVNGFDIKEKPLDARACMGAQLQSTSFHSELKIAEIFRLYAGLYNIFLNNDEMMAALETYKLADCAKKKFKQLSGGQQQRVSLLIATVHKPKLLILDEPTTGLDPQSRRQLWEDLSGFKKNGHAILLTTHSMEEAEAICDRIAIFDNGKIIAIDTPQNLVEKNHSNLSVISASKNGKITLEDVFVGLTGNAIRN